MTCPACARPCAVTVTHTLRIGRREIEWTVCAACEIRERNEQDGRASEAIKQAERAGA